MPDGSFRTIINGTTPLPGEIWSIGLNWRSPVENVGYDRLKQWSDEIALDIGALAGNSLISLLSDSGAITFIRCEERDPTTEVLMQASESPLATAKVGAGTPSKVLQTSLCVSLLTGRAGRSYRGRVYWPAWSYSGTATMQFGGSNLTSWVAAFRQIVNLIQVAGDASPGPLAPVLVVRSRLLHIGTDVVTYAVGSVPDTQRRRRDAAIEIYTQLAV